jgi:hypothetical protein
VVAFADIEDFPDVIWTLLNDDDMRLGIQLNALAFSVQLLDNITILDRSVKDIFKHFSTAARDNSVRGRDRL